MTKEEIEAPRTPEVAVQKQIERTVRELYRPSPNPEADWDDGASMIGQIAYRLVSAHLAASPPAPAVAQAEEVAWLLEWPQDDNLPARWWHPKGGWMLDPNRAIRFARREDAEAYRDNGHRFVSGIVATEHRWLSMPAPAVAQDGVEAKRIDEALETVFDDLSRFETRVDAVRELVSENASTRALMDAQNAFLLRELRAEKERAARAEADANRMAEAVKAAITLASQVEIFVKSKEQINRPAGVAWFDEEVEKLCAVLAEHDKGGGQ